MTEAVSAYPLVSGAARIDACWLVSFLDASTSASSALIRRTALILVILRVNPNRAQKVFDVVRRMRFLIRNERFLALSTLAVQQVPVESSGVLRPPIRRLEDPPQSECRSPTAGFARFAARRPGRLAAPNSTYPRLTRDENAGPRSSVEPPRRAPRSNAAEPKAARCGPQ